MKRCPARRCCERLRCRWGFLGRRVWTTKSRRRREQWPTLLQHVIQPCSGDLRCEDRHEHQRRVELGADDACIEGDASQHDARPATSVRGDGEVQQFEATKTGAPSSQGNRKNFRHTASDQKGSQHPQREATNEVELQSHNRKVHGDEKRKGNLPNMLERFGKEPALLVNDGKAGEERGENKAYIERSSHNAICEENRYGIADGRVFGKYIESRFVDSFHEPRDDAQSKREESHCREEVIRDLPRVQGCLTCYCGRQRQCEPQHDVLQHGDTEDEPRQACVEDIEISKNL